MKFKNDVIEGSVYHYRYIDHGAQYRVYAVTTVDGSQTGRVIKVPLSFEESKEVLAPHFALLNLTSEEIDLRVHTLMIRKQQLPGLVKGVFATDKKLMETLGDLKLVPVLTNIPKGSPDYFTPLFFTQDYVIPMGHFLHKFRFVKQRPNAVTIDDARQARQLAAAIVQLHYQLWEYGIFDTTFKLENIGIVCSAKNVERVILVDSAEHLYDLIQAEEILGKRKWHHATNVIKTDHLFLPIILHQQFMDVFDRLLTSEELHKRWRRKSRAIERRAVLKIKLRQLLTTDKQKSLALWLERQSLRSDLKSGIPSTRIDDTRIPQADLALLLADTRVGKVPLDEYARQEKAERTVHGDDDKTSYEMYRHLLSFPADNNI